MNCYLQRLITCIVIVLCCFLVTALPATAETDSDQNGWEFGVSAYLWAAGVEGTDTAGDEIDVSFSDTLEDLDGAFMGIIAAQKGRWTLIADFIYLSIHQETSSTGNLIGVPKKLDTDLKLKGYVSTLGAAYRIIDEDVTRLDLMAGARYFKLDLDFDADAGGEKIKLSDSEYVLDGIIGVQVSYDLNDSCYLSCYADVGAGDSKLTWQAWPGVGYRFEKIDVVAGYRHLAWENDGGDTVDDINFSGPMLGVTYRF